MDVRCWVIDLLHMKKKIVQLRALGKYAGSRQITVFCVAVVSGLLLASGSTASESSKHAVVKGTAIEGNFAFDEEGELYFSVSGRSSAALPSFPGGAPIPIGISNPEFAVSLLRLKPAMEKVDVREICGFQQPASIVVSNHIRGEGPSRPWYTVKLERVTRLGTLRFERCKEEKNS